MVEDEKQDRRKQDQEHCSISTLEDPFMLVNERDDRGLTYIFFVLLV
jgi:hypothetical protein